jgi:hypothetical protein
VKHFLGKQLLIATALAGGAGMGVGVASVAQHLLTVQAASPSPVASSAASPNTSASPSPGTSTHRCPNDTSATSSY